MESTVAQKLEALVKLQSIDSQLNELTKIRGALPDEVQDLEDEIIGYETRISNYVKDTEAIEAGIEENRSLCPR